MSSPCPSSARQTTCSTLTGRPSGWWKQRPKTGRWIRDKTLEDSADLEDPDLIAEEIADDLQAALEQFATIASDLRERNG